MLKKEEKLVRRYAKIMKFDPKIVMKMYEHGDETQRQIDYVAMEATIMLTKAKKEGKIIVDKNGRLIKESQAQINELIQKYLAGKKHVPQFFRKPLPMIIKEKSISGDKSKHKEVIE